jgi:hypothetical protein
VTTSCINDVSRCESDVGCTNQPSNRCRVHFPSRRLVVGSSDVRGDPTASCRLGKSAAQLPRPARKLQLVPKHELAVVNAICW